MCFDAKNLAFPVTPPALLLILTHFTHALEPTGFVHVNQNWITDKYVDNINELAKGRWTAARNCFQNFSESDLEALTHLYGYHPNPKFKPYTKRHEVNKESIPESFDAREKWPRCTSIGSIRNQRRCGASWAFAAAEVMTDRICVASQGMIEFSFSVEELISCCPACGDGCNSGYLYAPFEYWKNHGIPSGGDEYTAELLHDSVINELRKLTKGDLIDIIVTKEVPVSINVSTSTKEVIESGNRKNYLLRQGCKPFTAGDGHTPVCQPVCQPGYNVSLENDIRHGLSGYHVDTEVSQIQTEIMTFGPVVAAMDLYKDFFSYKSGVYEHVSWDTVGHHAVKIIGWGMEKGLPYWLVANSWGTCFGSEGFVKIHRGSNQCGIEYSVTAGTPNIFE